jgi:hypothetical protein
MALLSNPVGGFLLMLLLSASEANAHPPNNPRKNF